MAKDQRKKISKKSIAVKPTGSVIANNFNIIENLPSGCIVFDEKKIYFINGKGASSLGLKKSDLKKIEQLSFFDFLSEEHRKAIKKICASNNKKGSSCIALINKLKGKSFYAEIKLKAINKGNKKLYTALFYDISKQHKKEEATENNISDFNLILSCIDEVVYYVDNLSKKRRIKYISEHVEKIVGIDTEAYKKKGESILEYCHPDDVPKIMEVANRIRIEKKPQKFTYRFRHHQTGNYIWLEERVFPQFNNKKEHIANFGVSRDITREKHFENMLRESEQKFRVLAENANDIIYKYNYFPDPYYEYISPSVKKILGYSPDEFYTNSISGLDIMHPEDIWVLDFRNLNQIPEEPVTKTSRYFHKNGNTVWLETNYSLIKDAQGKIVSVQGISRDVTKEKETELLIAENERKFRLLAENALDIIFHYRFGDEPA